MRTSCRLLISALLPIVLIGIAAGTANAQGGGSAQPGAKVNTMLPAYDLSKEVKIQGSIEKIEESDGLNGAHMLVQTVNGIVDVHLGFGPASRSRYLGTAPGQNVSVIGMMMQTPGSSNVLLARVLTTPNHIFVLRNEHGIPVRATPRGSAHSQTLQRDL